MSILFSPVFSGKAWKCCHEVFLPLLSQTRSAPQSLRLHILLMESSIWPFFFTPVAVCVSEAEPRVTGSLPRHEQKKKKKCQHWILEKMVVSRHKYLGYCFLTKPSRQANKEFRWIVLMCAFGTPLIVSLKRPETPSFFSLVSNFLPSCYWGDISH